MIRRGVTIVEVLIAMMVIAGLGLAIYDSVIATTRGVAADRLTEAKRHLTLDILERLCQPYTIVPLLFRDVPKPYRRKLTLDEAFDLAVIPPEEAPTLRQILTTGGVEGFTLAWEPGRTVGRGDKTNALRLDFLAVTPVVEGASPGPRVESFRVFFARGEAPK